MPMASVRQMSQVWHVPMASVRQMSQVWHVPMASVRQMSQVWHVPMASVRQMSCHVMLKLPLHTFKHTCAHHTHNQIHNITFLNILVKV